VQAKKAKRTTNLASELKNFLRGHALEKMGNKNGGVKNDGEERTILERNAVHAKIENGSTKTHEWPLWERLIQVSFFYYRSGITNLIGTYMRNTQRNRCTFLKRSDPRNSFNLTPSK